MYIPPSEAKLILDRMGARNDTPQRSSETATHTEVTVLKKPTDETVQKPVVKKLKRPLTRDFNSSSMHQEFKKNKGMWPCLLRLQQIEEVRRLISKGDGQEALIAIGMLKEFFRERDEPNEKSFNFVIDGNSNTLLLELTRIVADQEIRWRRRGDFVCHQLSNYVIPPNNGRHASKEYLPSLETGMTELSLQGYILHNTPEAIHSLCHQCKGKLSSLTVLELGYVGINNEEALTILTHVANLRHLTYLGLKGNRLERTLIPSIIKLLQNPNSFKSLQRLDLRNNVDISTVPKTLLELLLQRWPPDVTQPTLAELAEGTLALQEFDL